MKPDKEKAIIIVVEGGRESLSSEMLEKIKKEYGEDIEIVSPEQAPEIKPKYDPFALDPMYIQPTRIINPYPIESLYGGLTKKQREEVLEPVRTEPKIRRNEPCPCGSKKKHKNCCLK